MNRHMNYHETLMQRYQELMESPQLEGLMEQLLEIQMMVQAKQNELQLAQMELQALTNIQHMLQSAINSMLNAPMGGYVGTPMQQGYQMMGQNPYAGVPFGMFVHQPGMYQAQPHYSQQFIHPAPAIHPRSSDIIQQAQRVETEIRKNLLSSETDPDGKKSRK